MNHPLLTYIRDLHTRFAPLGGGSVADYIPELAAADPNQ